MSDDYTRQRDEKLKLLSTAIASALSFGKRAKIDKEDFQHQLVIGSFLAMHELAESIHLLVQNNKAFDAEILLRSTMELRVRLEAFAVDRSIANRERVEFLRHNIKRLEESKRGNKYLAEFANHVEIQKEIDILSESLNALREAGVKGQFDFKALCDRFGFEHEYRAIYCALSQSPHGTYASIIKRNYEVNSKTQDWSVVGFRQPETETLDVICHQTASWLEHATHIVETFLQGSDIHQN